MQIESLSRLIKTFFGPIVFSVFLLGFYSPAWAQKTDIVYLENGDRVTAEIKDMGRGQLRLSTIAFGTILVRWEEVARIETDKQLQIEMVDGNRYFGSIQKSEQADEILVKTSAGTATLKLHDVIYLQSIKADKKFKGNLDTSVALGFSYTSASDVSRWNVNASTKYRTEKFLASVSYDSLITNNGSGADSRNRDLTLGYNRLFGKNTYWFASGTYQQNDELGIDNRKLLSIGLGRYLSQSTHHEFLLAAGLTGNWESTTETSANGSISSSSTEALFVADWTYFKLDNPKSDINVSLQVYPGLSNTERLRGQLRLRYRQEFVRDLFWNITYFDIFDTEPPKSAISKRDYGIITGLEYEF